MRTFLNHIKNETLDEIETSLENLWQQMIQLSEFFQYSFVLILKRKCLVRASRVRSGESGTPSTIIYIRWSSRRYELGCDTPVVKTATMGGSLPKRPHCIWSKRPHREDHYQNGHTAFGQNGHTGREDHWTSLSVQSITGPDHQQNRHTCQTAATRVTTKTATLSIPCQAAVTHADVLARMQQGPFLYRLFHRN